MSPEQWIGLLIIVEVTSLGFATIASAAEDRYAWLRYLGWAHVFWVAVVLFCFGLSLLVPRA